MSKKDEALKMALELLKAAYVPADLDEQRERTIKELEALAEESSGTEQPAQGCEFCSHPLYAGTKCKNCGKPAQQDIPKIGCVNHDCDKCKARQQQEHVSLMTVLHLKDRTEIGYGPASAGYDLPTGEYKLYTSPPASKPWVGLTRDERMSIINRLIGQDWVYALDAIEAKLKEKNA